MSVSDIVSKLEAFVAQFAKALHFGPSEAAKLETLRQKCIAARRENYDQMEALREQIGGLEARARNKKADLDSARGDSKRILIKEIELTFREIDALKGREGIISSNINRLTTTLAKMDELQAARQTGVEEGELDDLALDVEDRFDELKGLDKATNDLDRIQYAEPERAAVEVSNRLGNLEETREKESGLSEETLKRLKQLDSEEE